MSERSCGTCNMAGFTAYHRTPTGRFKKDAVAPCNYEIPIPVLPASVRGTNRLNAYPKGYVAPDDGSECPLYAPSPSKEPTK